ncbi:HAD-IA family hydrolase [Pseudooceanicola sp. CBS1P-1]|uniref:HAD-IA family hydrolase n=1 Tax=Pseudooceanicola albus TaxID=2692189 RepID=A0A6L7G926_9RHOB|nr:MULTISPECIES: HAD-IA family hydrolase [Pseudooceanicola]MBT9386542.1 HAD-IA family hydrolase [Pseudooceanicola endophyticus]MXN20575.1 HAD-IA family hydrolase [Pseudooceanicola albus]
MSLTDHKILTFDVVGTLIDFETGILDYFAPIFADLGREMDCQAVLAAYGRAEDAEHHRTPGIPFPPMLAPIYSAIADTFDLPDTPELREGLRLSIPDWPAFPDSVAALKRLGQHYTLVAMTNSDDWALDHFDATLDHPFDVLVTAEKAEACKPDPQVFGFVRGLMFDKGFRRSDYLHVAQSQYHDIGVSKALGYTTCWIERRADQDGFGASPDPAEVTVPDYHFTSLAALADAVEARVPA